MRSLKNYYRKIIVVMMLGFLWSCHEEFDPEIAEYPEITIDNFSPATSRPGGTVSISGTNFGERTEPVTVAFSGVEAEVTSTTDTEIIVSVPEDAATGKLSVKVWLSEKEFAEDFIVIPGAKITSVDAERGQPGDTVIITGTNFGNVAEQVSVHIGESEADLASVTDTEIIFTVPDTESGNLILDVGGQIVEGAYFLIGNELITGTLIGHEGSWGDNPDTEIPAAVDGDIETFVDGPGSPGYVGYDLGEDKAVLLTSVRYVPRESHPQRMVEGEIRGSNDPSLSDYEVLHTISETPEVGVYTEVDISTETSYRYIYYYDPNGGANISEIEFYGNITDPDIPEGKYIFEFDTDNGGWEPQQSASYVIEDGEMQVSFVEGGNRADLRHTPTTDANPWIYTSDYPILAMKYTKPAEEQMRPDIAIVDGGGIFGGKEYDDTYGEHDVYLWDLSQKEDLIGVDREEFRIVQIKIPDITSGETGYELDWIRTFKSTAELESFLGI